MGKFSLLLLLGVAITSCTSKTSTENNPEGFNVSDADQKDLQVAEKKMFTELVKFGDYWKTDVDDDYITVDADGAMHAKSEVLSTMDPAKKKMFEAVTDTKLSERKVRKYGDIAIINGRAEFFVSGAPAASVYYTEIWHKKNGKWFFNGWHGTFTKEMQETMMKGMNPPK
jgi:hypothetical protein